jgi:5-methylthioadenosine/S-adenosylhomocysteine deaminase
MTLEILTARWIVTGVADNDTSHMVEDAAIAHADCVILAAGPASEVTLAYPEAQVSAYANHMIMPGLINSHHYIGLTPLQMGAPDSPLGLWFAVRWAMGSFERVGASASDVLKAYKDIGMHVSYCYAVREQNRFVYEADEAFCNRLPPEAAKAMAGYFARQTLDFDGFMQLFDVLAAQNDSPNACIQLSPAGLLWMTDDGLLAIQEKSMNAGAPMHGGLCVP